MQAGDFKGIGDSILWFFMILIIVVGASLFGFGLLVGWLIWG